MDHQPLGSSRNTTMRSFPGELAHVAMCVYRVSSLVRRRIRGTHQARQLDELTFGLNRRHLGVAVLFFEACLRGQCPTRPITESAVIRWS